MIASSRPIAAAAPIDVPPPVVAVRSDDLSRASDAELAQALIEGHPGAPPVAWQRFLPLVRSVLHKSMSADREHEDIAQCVFVCLFQRVHTLRDPLAVRAFVVGVTLRVMREELRRQRKHLEGARHRRQPLPSHTLGIAADAASKLAFGKLLRLVRRLKRRDRATFVMRFVHGMETAEIASSLGISEPTARRSFSRAHKAISRWARYDPFLVDYVRK